MDNEIEYLPFFLRNNEIYSEVLNSDYRLYSQIQADIQYVKDQLFIESATWGLSIYEKEYGIKTDINKSLEERRSVIKSKMRGSGKLSSTLIKLVAESYTNGEVQVTFNEAIYIKFVSLMGIPPNIEDLKALLEDLKPAWIPINYIYTYQSWGEVEAFTWEALEAHTWEDILNGKVI